MRAFFEKHDVGVPLPGSDGFTQGVVIDVVTVEIRFEIEYLYIVVDERADNDTQADVYHVFVVEIL